MASLKEVKTRITSVGTTRKITQARQMISSAQLHRAQGVLAGALAYRKGLDEVFAQVAGTIDPLSPLYAPGKGSGVAVVVFSADGGMCGAYNAHIIKEMHAIAEKYGNDAQLFAIGKKAREAAASARYKLGKGYRTPIGKVKLEEVTTLAAELAGGFFSGRFGRVEILFSEFVTIATQRVRHQVLLPLAPPKAQEVKDYITEPTAGELVDGLVPMLITARINAALANSITSEHAARMTAMQLATENADELLGELQLMYNKLRQQNITAQLLDIIGSSFA